MIIFFISVLRSSHPDVFCEKGVLRNFAEFTGKHLCQSLFFNKVAGGAWNFIKKETLAQVFSCEFRDITKNTFFYRTRLVAASASPRSCLRGYIWICWYVLKSFWNTLKSFSPSLNKALINFYKLSVNQIQKIS